MPGNLLGDIVTRLCWRDRMLLLLPRRDFGATPSSSISVSLTGWRLAVNLRLMRDGGTTGGAGGSFSSTKRTISGTGIGQKRKKQRVLQELHYEYLDFGTASIV